MVPDDETSEECSFLTNYSTLLSQVLWIKAADGWRVWYCFVSTLILKNPCLAQVAAFLSQLPHLFHVTNLEAILP